LLFPIFIYIAMSIHADYLPYVLNGRRIEIKRSNKFLDWLRDFVITTLLFTGMLYLLYRYNRVPNVNPNIGGFTGYSDYNQYIYLIFSLILSILIIYYITRRQFTFDAICYDCGFYGGEECKYCHNESNNLTQFSATITKVPKCPNCGNNWDNLSRRCSNCQYTIVLICDNCSQTINPLWKKCNLCGEPRQPVPEIALGKQPDTRYSYIKAKYLMIILMTLPFLVIESVLLINILVPVISGQFFITLEQFLLLIHDNYGLS